MTGPQFRPLHKTFGAELTGVDFTKNIPEDEFQIIKKNLDKYGVLVVRKSGIDDHQHLAFAKRFGDLDDATSHGGPNRKYRLPVPQIYDVGNINDADEIYDPNSFREQIARGNGQFHTDGSIFPRRADVVILRAAQLPPPNTGGATEFADTRTAYEELDEEMKQKIEGKAGAFSIIHSCQKAAPNLERLKDMKATDHYMGKHLVAQVHEGSGRKNLYIASHLHHIEGMSDEESEALIDQLLEHASQPRYVLSVDWLNDNDLVIWSNTSVMHRATGGSYKGLYKRDMRRATLHDMSSQAWGCNKKTDERVDLFKLFGRK